jgi:hypothetical protein
MARRRSALLAGGLAAAVLVSAPSARAAGGIQVTMEPVGLSIEYPVLASYMGAGPCPPPALAAELQRLGSPALRLGGNSQDLTAPAGAAPPAESWRNATLFTLPAGFWKQLGCLLSTTHEPLTVGLNALSGTVAWANQLVTEAHQAASAPLSFAIGNEPDLYPLPNYASLGTRTVDVTAAVNVYLQLVALLRPAIGAAPLVGPDLATGSWQAWLPVVAGRVHPSALTVHAYPLSGCVTPAAVTLRGLLSQSAAEAPTRVQWVAADAAAAGVPATISEANSAACGGGPGVSDTPGAAVWALRFVLDALRSGFQQVGFHLSGGAYDPFVVHGGTLSERPLAGALAALNRWLPVGSFVRLVADRKGLVVTAISGPAGARLVVDNETAKPQRVALPGTAPRSAELFTPDRFGPAVVALAPRRGRVTLLLPAQSVAAIQ